MEEQGHAWAAAGGTVASCVGEAGLGVVVLYLVI